MKPQRQIRNFVLSPSLQLKFSLLPLALSLVFAIAFVVQLVYLYNQYVDLIIDYTEVREQILEIIDGQKSRFYMIVSVYCAIYVIVSTAIAIVMTHRLIGPTIAFRRHIKSLSDGKYDSRITLRKADAFSELAEDLNQLAAKLEAQQKR